MALTFPFNFPYSVTCQTQRELGFSYTTDQSDLRHNETAGVSDILYDFLQTDPSPSPPPPPPPPSDKSPSPTWPFLSDPQESGKGPTTSTTRTTVLDLLRENMDGPDLRRKKSLKERLGFVVGCCGSVWEVQPTVHDVDNEEEGGDTEIHHHQPPLDRRPQRGGVANPGCRVAASEAWAGMNLAAALAVEREGELSAPGTPLRVSLMRLLEEAEEGGVMAGSDSGCSVCMGRKKGSAFIPCGHTFCRVCSRELWLNRGTCPLCNRSILDILDIF